MDSRRSMGTSKPWTQPKRSSTVGAAGGVGTSAAISGLSKLPKLKTTGPPSSQKSRSSSIDAQSGARRATSATRSPSKTRTPLRALRHLVPLSGASSGGNMRSGYGGRESMTPNHRENVKVPVKDNRPLTDKGWQQEKLREIIDFCRTENYPGTLALNNFPLSSSEFRKLFEFLMRFLIPEFTMPKMQDMGTELPGMLKKIGYPGIVSKSTFQTIGTQHSWPATLGILSYLLLRAKACVNIMDSIDQILFQNKDDALEEACDRVLFDHFVDCYVAFHQGRDDYNDELVVLQQKFLQIYDVNETVTGELERKLARCKSEFDELKASSCNTDQLHQDYKDKKEDLNKMRDYSKMTQEHLHKKLEEFAIQEKKLQDLERRKGILKNSVLELEKFCREEKGVNPDEASGLEYMVHELERQVAQKKKAMDEANAVLWKTEQALSKRLVTIDDLYSQFNISLMELHIENAKSLVLGRDKCMEDVRTKLTHLAEESRQRERALKENISRFESELALLKQQLNRKVAEVKKNEEELRRRQDEHDTVLKKIDNDNAELTKALEDAKDKVLRNSGRDKRDLRGLEAELDRVQKELKAAKEEREKKAREGMELVHDINTFAMEEHERRVRERNEAIDMYQAEVKRVIAAILESKQDVQKFVKSLPKFKR